MHVEIRPSKVCTKCGDTKDITSFSVDEGLNGRGVKRYRDGRRSDCNDCRAIRRAQLRRGAQDVPVTLPVPLGYVPNPAYLQTAAEEDLPDPERLPAAYMKRVSDYWIDLIGGEEPATRIA